MRKIMAGAGVGALALIAAGLVLLLTAIAMCLDAIAASLIQFN